MTTQEVKRTFTAILSADVKGYSRPIAKDEVGTLQTLNTYKEVMANLIRHHHGRVVDAPGDGDNVLAEFASVVDAVQCAVEERRRRLNSFSVTLFGRTMAGKSTLMEILTRGDGQSIGTGAQRTSPGLAQTRSGEWPVTGTLSYDPTF